jgi:hypothetical protein
LQFDTMLLACIRDGGAALEVDDGTTDEVVREGLFPVVPTQ